MDFRKVGDHSWALKIDSKGMKVDVTFDEAQHGSAMMPATWDGEKVVWSSTIGTAEVNGTITFPSGETVQVNKWVGEEERMAGLFKLAPGHRGYEYAQSGNPDGSADQLFAFPNLDGTWTGHMAHTTKAGVVTTCTEPSVQLSDWSHYINLDYPRTVAASCGGPTPLSHTWTVTEEHMLPLGLTNFGVNPVGLGDATGLGTTTMSDGHSDVAGSVATIQHLRNNPLYGH